MPTQLNGFNGGKKLPAKPRGGLGATWYDIRVRSWLYQLVVIFSVILLGALLIGNAQDALSRQGISTGFGFLVENAGFEIGEKLIPFQSTDSFVRAYSVAVLNTLKVSLVSIIVATIIGITFGIGKLSSNLLIRKISALYVELFRNTPQLVQLIFWYTVITRLPGPRQAFSIVDVIFISNRGLVIPWFSSQLASWLLFSSIVASLILFFLLLKLVNKNFLGQKRAYVSFRILAFLIALIPVFSVVIFGPNYTVSIPEMAVFNYMGGLTVFPEFLTLLLGLSLYIGAFIAEIVRSGLKSVNLGQIEAAQSVGLKRRFVYSKIIFPQALRVMIPPVTAQYVSIIKNSSLGVAIGYPELFNINNTIITLSGHTVEAIAIMMSIYLIISFGIAILMNIYNHNVQLKSR